MVVVIMHYEKQRRESELKQALDLVEIEIKHNIEQNAVLTKEKMSIKRELWELRGDEC